MMVSLRVPRPVANASRRRLRLWGTNDEGGLLIRHVWPCLSRW